MAKRPTAAQKAIYEEFAETFQFCWACGFQTFMSRSWHLGTLENAHIVGGPGRRHDRRAITRLCQGCHVLAHGATIKLDGKNALPNLNRGNLIWLKERYDNAFYTWGYLNTLSIGRLEDPEPLPAWFDETFHCIGPQSLRKSRGTPKIFR